MAYPHNLWSNKLKEIGNALNSILSFMQRAKAINVFEELGIQVFADEAKTQFRSVMEIFEDLASRWQDDSISEAAKNQLVDIADAAGLYTEEMAEAAGVMDEYEQAVEAVTKSQGKFSDREQRDAAQAAAGIYRRNYLIALLKNWNKVYDVLATQEQAHGYSMKENERTMEGYTKKLQTLKTALAELAVEITAVGVLDGLKSVVDGTKEAVEVFSALPEVIQKVIVAFGALTVALATLQLTTRILFGVSLPMAIKTLAAYAIGISTAEAGTLGFGVALGALLPYILPLSALAVVVANIAKQFSYAKQEAEELSTVPSDIKQFEGTEKLAKEYETLSGKLDKTTEETNRLTEVKRQLAEQFPEVVDEIDAEGNAISLNNEQLEESIRLRREELEIRREQLAKEFRKGSASKDLKDKQEQLNNLNEELEKMLEKEITLDWKFFAKLALFKGKLPVKDVSDLRLEINQLQQEMTTDNSIWDEKAAAVLSTSEAFSKLSDPVLKKLVSTLRELNNGDIDKTDKQITKLAESGKKVAPAIDAVQTSLEKLNETEMSAESVEEFDIAFQNLINTLLDGELGLNLTSDAANILAYSLLDTIDPTTAAQIKLHHLNQTMNDVREGSITMADAASRASAIMSTNITEDAMRCISAYKEQIKTQADLVKAMAIATEEMQKLAVKQAKAIYGTRTDDPVLNWARTDYIHSKQQELGPIFTKAGEIIAIAETFRGVGGGGGGRSTGSPSKSAGSPSKGLKDTAKAAEKAVTWLDKFKESLENAIPPDILYRFNKLNKELTSLDWSTSNRQLTVLGRELEYFQTKASSTSLSAGEFARAEEIIAEKTKLLNKQLAMTAPFMSDINQNIHKQISYLKNELAKAEGRYAKARSNSERREALEAIKLAQDALEELWALYDRSNQMAWDIHAEKLELLRVKLDMFNGSLKAAVPPDVLLRFHELDRVITSLDWTTPTRQLTVLNRELEYLQTRMSMCIPVAGDLARTQELIADKAKLLQEQTSMVAPFASEINQNIHKQIGILQDELKDAYAWYAAAETEDEKRIALEAIKTTTDAIDELWALYDRSNQMAWDNHTEMLQMAALYAESVFDEYRRAAQQEIRAIQKELDAMDSEDALKDHHKRIEDLQEERRYHELRTGKEHAKAIEEIDKQIQEEQESWAREQEKQALRDRIDFLEEQQQLIDEQLVKLLVTLAAHDEDWYNMFKTWADEAVEGWRAGNVGEAITGELLNILNVLAEQYGIPIDIPEYNIPEAHTGAKVGSTGLAMLLKGERVLSPELTVSFDRLANVLSKTNIPNDIVVGGRLEGKLDKLLTILETKSGVQINGHLVNMEHVGFEDNIDVRAFSREIKRTVDLLRR